MGDAGGLRLEATGLRYEGTKDAQRPLARPQASYLKPPVRRDAGGCSCPRATLVHHAVRC